MALASFLHAAHGWAEDHRWSSGGEGASQRAAGWAGPPDCHRTMASARGTTGKCYCGCLSKTRLNAHICSWSIDIKK